MLICRTVTGSYGQVILTVNGALDAETPRNWADIHGLMQRSIHPRHTTVRLSDPDHFEAEILVASNWLVLCTTASQ